MIPEADTLHFCDLIRQKLGLNFDRDKLDFVSGILEQRSAGRPSAYLSRIEPDEWRALAEQLTVTETFFSGTRPILPRCWTPSLRTRT